MIHRRGDHDRKRVDLSPLDPTADAMGLDRYVRAIMSAASAELLRRQARVGLDDLIVCWRRPILEAAVLLACAAAAVLLVIRESPAASEGALAEALGIPRTWAEWVQTGERPTPGELLEAGGSEP